MNAPETAADCFASHQQNTCSRNKFARDLLIHLRHSSFLSPSSFICQFLPLSIHPLTHLHVAMAITAQKVFRQTSWTSLGGLRISSLSSNIFLSIYFSNWLNTSPKKTGPRGNRYPTATKFLRVTPSKLESSSCSEPIGITSGSIKLSARNSFELGVLQL